MEKTFEIPEWYCYDGDDQEGVFRYGIFVPNLKGRPSGISATTAVIHEGLKNDPKYTDDNDGLRETTDEIIDGLLLSGNTYDEIRELIEKEVWNMYDMEDEIYLDGMEEQNRRISFINRLFF